MQFDSRFIFGPKILPDRWANNNIIIYSFFFLNFRMETNVAIKKFTRYSNRIPTKIGK